jgi:cytochrome P450 family 142 subfamily A polypeptide 1
LPDHPTHPDVRLTAGDFYAGNAHEMFDWMRANAPVYWDAAGSTWGIARYDDVMTVSKDPATFCNGAGMRPDAPVPMPFMISLDDPMHKRRRGLVNKGFTVRRVQEREARIRQISRDLIAKGREMGRFDFVMDLAAWLPLIVIGDMLGVVPERYADLLRWSDDLVRGTGATNDEILGRAAVAFEEYTTYQTAVIAERRRSGATDDLVGVLVHAEIDGEKLTDEELLWESLLILVGGDETTRHVITGGTYELLRDPSRLNALRRDPSRIPVAVEEMLRWVTPIQNMARTATRDVELRGQRIRAGDKLVLLYPSANRDERVFRDPHRFDIARSPNEHIAFGFGAHFCLGASLARLELRVFFEELVAGMADLALASNDPPPLRASNFIVGIEHLDVVVGSAS